jgi:hypothetical protein
LPVTCRFPGALHLQGFFLALVKHTVLQIFLSNPTGRYDPVTVNPVPSLKNPVAANKKIKASPYVQKGQSEAGTDKHIFLPYP